jgi:hypothetical protein
LSDQRQPLFGKKPRPVQDLMSDPNALLMIGRTQGAIIMLSHWLGMREDDESKKMGQKMEEITSWFFEGRK